MTGRGRERRLARAREGGPRAGRGTWLQLFVLAGVLAILFASWDELGGRAAGCVSRFGGDAPAGAERRAVLAPSSSGAKGGAGAARDAEKGGLGSGAFEVRIERRPAATGP